MVLYNMFQGGREHLNHRAMIFSTFLDDVEKGVVKSVDIKDQEFKEYYKSKST